VSDDVMRAIGRIEGRLEGIDRKLDGHGTKLDCIDGRLRSVERKAVINGSTFGAAAAAGLTLVIEGAKRGFGGG